MNDSFIASDAVNDPFLTSAGWGTRPFRAENA